MLIDDRLRMMLRILCPICGKAVFGLVPTQRTGDELADYQASACQECYEKLWVNQIGVTNETDS